MMVRCLHALSVEGGILALKKRVISFYDVISTEMVAANIFLSWSIQRVPNHVKAGPRSAVGNVSSYRCVSTSDPGVASSIPVRSHTFIEIDHEIISTVILLPSADSFKKGCCQLQAN